jgi:hypothetical protein
MPTLVELRARFLVIEEDPEPVGDCEEPTHASVDGQWLNCLRMTYDASHHERLHDRQEYKQQIMGEWNLGRDDCVDALRYGHSKKPAEHEFDAASARCVKCGISYDWWDMDRIGVKCLK